MTYKLQYNDLSNIDLDHRIRRQVLDYDDVDDCGNPRISNYVMPDDPGEDDREFESMTEHLRTLLLIRSHCLQWSI